LLAARKETGVTKFFQSESVLWVRIRINVVSWIWICIRIRINLQIKSQNEWNMSLFQQFFKIFTLFLQARIRIRIPHQSEKKDPDPQHCTEPLVSRHVASCLIIFYDA
jgi:hypothetical protein